MIIWVIAPPLFAFFILLKNRNQLEEDHMKNYYLILYQGLRREVFYWEFINTIRKILIISLSTVFSILSLEYKILLGIILLIIIVRIQIRKDPYKFKVNNQIEVMSIIAGMLILYCGIIFEEGQDHDYSLFDSAAMFILILSNGVFVTQWLYYFLVSFNFKNKRLKMFVMIYGYVLCKGKEIKAKSNELDIDETQHLNTVNDNKSHRKDKPKPKKPCIVRPK